MTNVYYHFHTKTLWIIVDDDLLVLLMQRKRWLLSTKCPHSLSLYFLFGSRRRCRRCSYCQRRNHHDHLDLLHFWHLYQTVKCLCVCSVRHYKHMIWYNDDSANGEIERVWKWFAMHFNDIWPEAAIGPAVCHATTECDAKVNVSKFIHKTSVAMVAFSANYIIVSLCVVFSRSCLHIVNDYFFPFSLRFE